MNPVNRWFPVLTKYLGLVSGRVNGLGGNSEAIPPTLGGVPPSLGCGRGGKGGNGCHCCYGEKHGCEEHRGCKRHEDHHRHHEQPKQRKKHSGIGCVGRITCMLYDECGKFVEFCVWEEERKIEKRLRAGDDGINDLIKKAWDEKWIVEVIAEGKEDGEVEIVKGIIFRRD